jgi:hypothetical protein
MLLIIKCRFWYHHMMVQVYYTLCKLGILSTYTALRGIERHDDVCQKIYKELFGDT